MNIEKRECPHCSHSFIPEKRFKRLYIEKVAEFIVHSKTKNGSSDLEVTVILLVVRAFVDPLFYAWSK